jgi:hypothetical protein
VSNRARVHACLQGNTILGMYPIVTVLQKLVVSVVRAVSACSMLHHFRDRKL